MQSRTTHEIDKLGWVCIQNRKLLCARSHGKDSYYIPGGKREPGETDSEALIREIQEELSVQLVPETLHLADVFKAQAHGKPEGTLVKITCYYAEFKGTLQAHSEIAEITWLGSSQREKCSLVTQIILDSLLSQGKID